MTYSDLLKTINVEDVKALTLEQLSMIGKSVSTMKKKFYIFHKNSKEVEGGQTTIPVMMVMWLWGLFSLLSFLFYPQPNGAIAWGGVFMGSSVFVTVSFLLLLIFFYGSGITEVDITAQDASRKQLSLSEFAGRCKKMSKDKQEVALAVIEDIQRQKRLPTELDFQFVNDLYDKIVQHRLDVTDAAREEQKQSKETELEQSFLSGTMSCRDLCD